MNEKQKKQYMIIAAGVIAVYLAYRWYAGRQTTANTGTATPATDTAASDYASLAGQEQGDVAALQSQNTGLLSQEQSDVSGLQGTLSSLTATVDGLTGQVANIAVPDLSGIQNQITALASGQAKANRAAHATVTTHKNGAFYDYYKRITGKAPPAHVATSNFVYQAWKNGVKASALAPPAKHPSSKNTQIAHPNGNHAAQTGNHKQAAKPKAPPHSAPPKKKAKAKVR
jgi:hypothetical protein